MPTPAGMRDESVLNAVFGPELYQWLTQTALTQLGRAGQVIIAKYVTVLMAAAAEVKMLMIRLRYEDGAWYVHCTLEILLLQGSPSSSWGLNTPTRPGQR